MSLGLLCVVANKFFWGGSTLGQGAPL